MDSSFAFFAFTGREACYIVSLVSHRRWNLLLYSVTDFDAAAQKQLKLKDKNNEKTQEVQEDELANDSENSDEEDSKDASQDVAKIGPSSEARKSDSASSSRSSEDSESSDSDDESSDESEDEDQSESEEENEEDGEDKDKQPEVEVRKCKGRAKVANKAAEIEKTTNKNSQIRKRGPGRPRKVEQAKIDEEDSKPEGSVDESDSEEASEKESDDEEEQEQEEDSGSDEEEEYNFEKDEAAQKVISESESLAESESDKENKRKPPIQRKTAASKNQASSRNQVAKRKPSTKASTKTAAVQDEGDSERQSDSSEDESENEDMQTERKENTGPSSFLDSLEHDGPSESEDDSGSDNELQDDKHNNQEATNMQSQAVADLVESKAQDQEEDIGQHDPQEALKSASEVDQDNHDVRDGVKNDSISALHSTMALQNTENKQGEQKEERNLQKQTSLAESQMIADQIPIQMNITAVENSGFAEEAIPHDQECILAEQLFNELLENPLSEDGDFKQQNEGPEEDVSFNADLHAKLQFPSNYQFTDPSLEQVESVEKLTGADNESFEYPETQALDSEIQRSTKHGTDSEIDNEHLENLEDFDGKHNMSADDSGLLAKMNSALNTVPSKQLENIKDGNDANVRGESEDNESSDDEDFVAKNPKEKDSENKTAKTESIHTASVKTGGVQPKLGKSQHAVIVSTGFVVSTLPSGETKSRTGRMQKMSNGLAVRKAHSDAFKITETDPIENGKAIISTASESVKLDGKIQLDGKIEPAKKATRISMEDNQPELGSPKDLHDDEREDSVEPKVDDRHFEFAKHEVGSNKLNAKRKLEGEENAQNNKKTASLDKFKTPRNKKSRPEEQQKSEIEIDQTPVSQIETAIAGPKSIPPPIVSTTGTHQPFNDAFVSLFI